MGANRYNASLEARRIARAQEILERLRQELPGRTPDELIAHIDLADPQAIWNPTGVRYYVLRDQTPLIAAELRRRGEAARPTLARCAKDRRQIFTGSAGPGLTLGSFCQALLQALDSKRAEEARP